MEFKYIVSISITLSFSILIKINFPVTWLKDGKAIPETSSRYHFSSDGNTSFEFGIKICTANDVGQYSARAIGQKGETNSAFALNVVSPGEL